MKKKFLSTAALLLVCAVLFSAFSVIGGKVKSTAESDVGVAGTPSASKRTAGAVGADTLSADDKPVEVSGLAWLGSYSELYEALTAANTYNGYSNGYDTVVTATGSFATAAAEAEMPAEDFSDADESYADYNSADYSDTNVQVEGIDEGDIVKTDGAYIYHLSNYDHLSIYRADGAETELVYSEALGESERSDNSGTERNPNELYLCGDRLAVIENCYSWSESYDEDTDCYSYENNEYTDVSIYDVSKPENPILLTRGGQDGYYVSSRLSNGVLYLVTSYYVYDYNGYNEADPSTYAPCVYINGAAEVMPADCIYVAEVCSNYAVVGAMDISDGEYISRQSILGGGDNVYMSADNLYITGTGYENETSEEYTDGIYTVADHNSYQYSEILRFALGDDGAFLAAENRVNGSLINQFALDEYEGCLRVVTTMSGEFYRTYTDKEHGWTNYEWDSSTSSTALYVLDMSLNVIGSIENLAEGEYVYSVRFDGDVGYFVTFRSTDPLFCADLSDPYAPVLLSELKLPGFSEYMHIYGENLLFGLGLDADEETGATGCVKLTMFDTADKTAISVIDNYIIDGLYYTEALYEHHAVLISQAKNIIAFPGDNGYCVFGWSEDGSFVERGSLEPGWSYNTRGLFIGDALYICCNDGLYVYDLEELTELCSIIQ